MNKPYLHTFLDQKVEHFNSPEFIEDDPISIPHLFTKKQDIEIAAFFSAILSWGNRTTIINNCRLLMELMDYEPHEFICHHEESDLRRFLDFKHRTFNPTDLLFFISFFKQYYTHFNSLEYAFSAHLCRCDRTIEKALTGFYNTVFSGEHPERTHKHISTPAKNSACKRLNMFLRWMVRSDENGVDFGIWKQISPAQLIMPMDVHVLRVAQRLHLINTDKPNWQTALELTGILRQFDAADPVKYDFALFGLGVIDKVV